jgi:hypothetical protein
MIVMAARDAAIHKQAARGGSLYGVPLVSFPFSLVSALLTWMRGSSPRMTINF